MCRGAPPSLVAVSSASLSGLRAISGECGRESTKIAKKIYALFGEFHAREKAWTSSKNSCDEDFIFGLIYF